MTVDFIDFQQIPMWFHKSDQKQELRELLQHLLHANRSGNAGAVTRIALDMESVIEKL
jgi:hypothetical protein